MAGEFDAYELAVPGIRQLSPYDPGLPIEEIERRYGIKDAVKLASNENPLGASPRVTELIQSRCSDIHRYPDGGGYELKQAIAARHGVLMDQICLGKGSNDVLDMAARCFVSPGQNGIISQHAFVVYYLSLVYVHAQIKMIDALGYGHDLAAMADAVDADTRIMYIANPNNPTGTWSTESDLRSLLDTVPQTCIVVVDEAYAEYVDEPDYPDCSTWLDDYPNLVVTRTFSKMFALAGLRVGYSLSSPKIGDLLNRARQPFNCSSLGLAAATASLSDHDHVERSRKMNLEQMEVLCRGFAELGLETIDSVGNFVCVDLQKPAQSIFENLLRRGVIVRPIGGYGMPNHLRVSVGIDSENQRVLAEFARLRESGEI